MLRRTVPWLWAGQKRSHTCSPGLRHGHALPAGRRWRYHAQGLAGTLLGSRWQRGLQPCGDAPLVSAQRRSLAAGPCSRTQGILTTVPEATLQECISLLNKVPQQAWPPQLLGVTR
jgi:hypothetical protein